MIDSHFEGTEESVGAANLKVKEWFLRGDYTILPDALLSNKSLTPATKLVLMGLLSHIRKQGGGKCFPSEETLARKAAVANRTVRSAKSSLRAHGWLDWTKVPGSMPPRCIYTLSLPKHFAVILPNDAEELTTLPDINTQ